ncbi:MAG: ATP-binding protein [Halopseudomonas aestusnigri]
MVKLNLSPNKSKTLPHKSSPIDHFVVDSGLKNIIGQELITNDFVAIYELVKNSLDAHATKVDLIIQNDRLIVADNGKGMLVNDKIDEIRSKWLRVAYSAKKYGVEDQALNDDFRAKIATRKRSFGGNKGVGRFSCDRLGERLTLYTKTSDQAEYNKLNIEWGDFEGEELIKFEEVNLKRSIVSSIPSEIHNISGSANTILVISKLRNDWYYKKLQSLKKELAQLINPFEENADIQIEIHASQYTEKDSESEVDFTKVNGLIRNNIYEAIGLSTTKIEVQLRNGIISTKLLDRGELIYEIKEESKLETINNIPIDIDLSFLNRAAKNRFTKFMGITALDFGHVFLFKNGYRVMPYGVRGNDILGYDDRKSQGQRRYLGSRDLLGQINIRRGTNLLIEPSSRDGGLIKNTAYNELETLFKENALKRLESYVVGITYKDNTDKDREDIKGIYKERARVRVIDLISRLVSSNKVEVVEYHKDLVNIIDEKSSNFNDTIENLKQIATVSKNKYLLDQIKSAESKFSALEIAQNEAILAEIEAKKIAGAETAKATAALEAQKLAENKLEQEIKRSLFLKSLTEVEVEDVIGLNHQVVYDATNIKNTVTDALQRITLDDEYFNGSVALQILQSISLSNQKVLLASQFATRANFSHQSDGITEDMIAYIKDYILVSVKPNVSNINVNIGVEGNIEFLRKFKPLELSIVIDNFVSNSRKPQHSASEINFHISICDGLLNILVSDNGKGLDPDVDISRIFDLGYSGTKGSGIGLYHIESVLKQLNGSIQLVETPDNRANFLVEIGK